MNAQWTPRDDAAILAGWAEGRTAKAIAAALCRSKNSIIGRIHRLQAMGLAKGRENPVAIESSWTPARDALIREKYTNGDMAELFAAINRLPGPPVKSVKTMQDHARTRLRLRRHTQAAAGPKPDVWGAPAIIAELRRIGTDGEASFHMGALARSASCAKSTCRSLVRALAAAGALEVIDNGARGGTPWRVRIAADAEAIWERKSKVRVASTSRDWTPETLAIVVAGWRGDKSVTEITAQLNAAGAQRKMRGVAARIYRMIAAGELETRKRPPRVRPGRHQRARAKPQAFRAPQYSALTGAPVRFTRGVPAEPYVPRVVAPPHPGVGVDDHRHWMCSGVVEPGRFGIGLTFCSGRRPHPGDSWCPECRSRFFVTARVTAYAQAFA